MPTASEWSDATTVAGALLGVTARHTSPLRPWPTSCKVVERATALPATVPSLSSPWSRRTSSRVGRPASDSTRTPLRRAGATAAAPEGCRAGPRMGRGPTCGATPAAAGTSLASAMKVECALNGFPWDRLGPFLRSYPVARATLTAAALRVVDSLRGSAGGGRARHGDRRRRSRTLTAASSGGWPGHSCRRCAARSLSATEAAPVIDPPVQRAAGRPHSRHGTPDAFIAELRISRRASGGSVEVTWRVLE